MGLARITVFLSVISSLFLLSQARYVLDDFSSTAVTVQDPPEDTDRKAIVPLEKPSSSDESIPAVEGFHHVVDPTLRRPIDHHFIRPINSQFLPRKTPPVSGRIGFPSHLSGVMRWIPTRRTPETDDVFGKLEESLAQDLTEVHAAEAKEWIPVEWKAREEEEEEHKRKKKRRDHKKKKERGEDSDSDSDSDDDDEEKKEIKKKKKGGLLKWFWAFLNRF
ncbi:hypothetical protein COCNU_02G003070 [Cocos nucifera]|uniref:Uncharacterized protein n=1 Tax=Cocos nucifera TaxID=13894 RepID=A0A8K0HY36_COCNU|nr:hypothetical protein COCNU_02G003070 [Cocos nucifera]